MKEFVKNYGAALMVFVSAIAVLELLFFGVVIPKGNIGLYSALGEGAGELSEQTRVSASAEKIKEIKSRPIPDIAGKIVFANTEYTYDEVFANTEEETLLEVKCIRNTTGEDVTEAVCHAENQTLCFPMKGTYRVRILADDKGGGMADGWVTVKVQDM